MHYHIAAQNVLIQIALKAMPALVLLWQASSPAAWVKEGCPQGALPTASQFPPCWWPSDHLLLGLEVTVRAHNMPMRVVVAA